MKGCPTLSRNRYRRHPFVSTNIMKACLIILNLVLYSALAALSSAVESSELVPGVVQELWQKVQGSSVKALTHQKFFEKISPDIKKIHQFDVSNLGNQYGARYSALLRVPVTGEYRLYLASDDSAELWMGKDASQKDMTCIATVKGYSDWHNWENQSNQASAPIYLEEGKLYFLLVIHKEDGGQDHMSVAWSGPEIPKAALIPPSALFIPPGLLPALQSQEPASVEQ